MTVLAAHVSPSQAKRSCRDSRECVTSVRLVVEIAPINCIHMDPLIGLTDLT